VGAIFDGKKGKRSDDAPAEGSKSREPHRKDKRGKKGNKPRCEAREQGRDGDDAEALAVDPARRSPRPAPRGPRVFDDMLKKPCPYHKTPVNHTLEQCDMLKKFYGRAAAKEAEAKKDGGDGDAGGFPAVENVFLIFGGPTVHMTTRQRKRERHKVLAAEKAPPSFLNWSEDAITFSREDHPNRIPNYTSLKMKMPGPNGVITVGSSIEHAFDCDIECVEHAEALALDEALVTTLEKMVNEDLDSASKHAGTFEAAEQTKGVPLDPAAPEGKVLRVSSTLDPK
jgi:hypothetical protein